MLTQRMNREREKQLQKLMKEHESPEACGAGGPRLFTHDCVAQIVGEMIMTSPTTNGGLQQTCKVCGQRDKFDFGVPDKLWESVVGPNLVNRVVCLSCFDDLAFDKGVEYKSQLEHLLFAGNQETLLLSMLPDTRDEARRSNVVTGALKGGGMIVFGSGDDDGQS